MKRDELNVLADKYYEVMDISKDRKDKLKEDAYELFDLFMLFFYWFEEAEENGVENTTYFLPRFQNEMQEVISSITDVDDYFISYIAIMALGIFSVTQAHKGEKYYLSEDRAVNLALNESLSINNHIDLVNAKRDGYKFKVWKSQIDERTREEHLLMDGTKIPIDSYFEFSDSRGLFPHDTVNLSENQTCNCRCWLEYK